MGTEGEQTRSGEYPERDGGEEGGEGLGLGYYLVYRYHRIFCRKIRKCIFEPVLILFVTILRWQYLVTPQVASEKLIFEFRLEYVKHSLTYCEL